MKECIDTIRIKDYIEKNYSLNVKDVEKVKKGNH